MAGPKLKKSPGQLKIETAANDLKDARWRLYKNPKSRKRAEELIEAYELFKEQDASFRKEVIAELGGKSKFEFIERKVKDAMKDFSIIGTNLDEIREGVDLSTPLFSSSRFEKISDVELSTAALVASKQTTDKLEKGFKEASKNNKLDEADRKAAEAGAKVAAAIKKGDKKAETTAWQTFWTYWKKTSTFVYGDWTKGKVAEWLEKRAKAKKLTEHGFSGRESVLAQALISLKKKEKIKARAEGHEEGRAAAEKSYDETVKKLNESLLAGIELDIKMIQRAMKAPNVSEEDLRELKSDLAEAWKRYAKAGGKFEKPTKHPSVTKSKPPPVFKFKERPLSGVAQDLLPTILNEKQIKQVRDEIVNQKEIKETIYNVSGSRELSSDGGELGGSSNSIRKTLLKAIRGKPVSTAEVIRDKSTFEIHLSRDYLFEELNFKKKFKISDKTAFPKQINIIVYPNGSFDVIDPSAN